MVSLRLKELAEASAQAEIDSDEEMQKRWQKGKAAAEVSIMKAMQSVDKEEKIDTAFDFTQQLTKAYKKKLGDSSLHLINQIDNQRLQVRRNVGILDRQIEHSMKNPHQPYRPGHDPTLDDFTKAYDREVRAKRIKIAIEKTKLKELKKE